MTDTDTIELRDIIVDDDDVFELVIDPLSVADPLELFDLTDVNEFVKESRAVIEGSGLYEFVIVAVKEDEPDTIGVKEDDRVYDDDADAIYVGSGMEVKDSLTLAVSVED